MYPLKEALHLWRRGRPSAVNGDRRRLGGLGAEDGPGRRLHEGECVGYHAERPVY